MLGRLRTQHDFWDAQLYERAIPEDHHLLRRIDECVDFSFVEEETSDLYCSDNGRSSYAPEQLFRVMFVSYLQQPLTDLSPWERRAAMRSRREERKSPGPRWGRL